MKTKNLKIPAIIIVIGLVVAVVAHLLTSIQLKPTVTEHDFEYSVTYKLNGETKTINGVYNCSFSGFGSEGIDPLDRYYTGEYTVDGNTTTFQSYTIAEKDTVDLYIVTLFNDSYLMNDTKNYSYYPSLDDPYLEAADSEGYAYESDEEELLNMFDAEIVSWEYPEPIENSFVFAGFAGLHTVSVVAMMIVGVLALAACMIFVKKADDVVYNLIDKVGIFFNFAAAFFGLPIVSITVYLVQAFQTGPDWIYQVDLATPPIILFSLAASVSLRRKGFRVSGFLIQFFGFAVLLLFGILEYVL